MRAEDHEGRFTALFGRRPRRPGVYAEQPERADLSVESATPVQTGRLPRPKQPEACCVPCPHRARPNAVCGGLGRLPVWWRPLPSAATLGPHHRLACALISSKRERSCHCSIHACSHE